MIKHFALTILCVNFVLGESLHLVVNILLSTGYYLDTSTAIILDLDKFNQLDISLCSFTQFQRFLHLATLCVSAVFPIMG